MKKSQFYNFRSVKNIVIQNSQVKTHSVLLSNHMLGKLNRRRQETYTVSTAGQKYLKAALPILMDVYKRTEDLLPEQWF